MNQAFILNLTVSPLEIRDAIDNRLIQARAVITCLMFAVEFLKEEITLDRGTIYDTLWLADSLLEEISILFYRIKESKNDTIES